jgi:uncharacterized protein YlxP (DUF503 family)
MIWRSGDRVIGSETPGIPRLYDQLALEKRLTRVNPLISSSRILRVANLPIAYLTLELRIEGAHSLKDKRQVLRSVKDRLRNSFNVAVAEMDATDLWQRATIGVVSISDSRDYLEGLMRNVEREAVRLANNAGAEVVDSFLDYVES